jgi:hypothetical protein
MIYGFPKQYDVWSPRIVLNNSPYASYYGNNRPQDSDGAYPFLSRYDAFSFWGCKEEDNSPVGIEDNPCRERCAQPQNDPKPLPLRGGRAGDSLKMLMGIIMFIFLHKSSLSGNGASMSRKDILSNIIDKFDALKEAGDLKDGVFGMEDVSAILKDPGKFSGDVVSLAQNINQNQDLIDLADWVSNSSGPHTHDQTNDKLQYKGALEVLNDTGKIKTVIKYLKDNFAQIAALGGNTTALEREDVEARITALNQGSDADKALAETLSKLYYSGADSSSKRDLITILANASGNNSSSSQTLTQDGLNRLQGILDKCA